VNEIENFWEIAKSRLINLRGIQKDKFYLDLKETARRFNHRHENIYALLLNSLRKSPL
jgi:transposase-like protein